MWGLQIGIIDFDVLFKQQNSASVEYSIKHPLIHTGQGSTSWRLPVVWHLRLKPRFGTSLAVQISNPASR